MTFKIGLALGGGAARGLAHLGVIKVLEEAGIKIDVITGASIGGIMASIYACCPDIARCTSMVREHFQSENFDSARLDFIRNSDSDAAGYFSNIKQMVKKGLFLGASMGKQSFISAEDFRGNIESLLPEDQNIEDCKLKLGLVALDLHHGREIIFEQGRLIEHVLASCAIPGVFPPIKINGRIYVDGSWANPLPVDLAKTLGANFVIGVDIAPHMNHEFFMRNGMTISLRAGEGTRQIIKARSLDLADHAVSVDVMEVHWADFSQLGKCMKRGEAVMKESIETLQKKISKAKWKYRMTHPFSF